MSRKMFTGNFRNNRHTLSVKIENEMLSRDRAAQWLAKAERKSCKRGRKAKAKMTQPQYQPLPQNALKPGDDIVMDVLNTGWITAADGEVPF